MTTPVLTAEPVKRAKPSTRMEKQHDAERARREGRIALALARIRWEAVQRHKVGQR